MPKYRLLTAEELYALEKEFVEYLIVNGIDAADWERMKRETPDAAEQMIDLFSDVVFESIMRKAKFLENRSPRQIHAFQCLQDRIVLVGLRAGANAPAEVDFTDATFIKTAMERPPAYLEVFTTQKLYGKIREVELFEMTMQGCSLSDGSLFKALSLLMATSGDV